MQKILCIIAIFLFSLSCAIGFEYKIATEDDINKLFEEIKDKPGAEFTRTSYTIEIADVYESATYYFTDTGHFAHPSVVIECNVIKDQPAKAIRQRNNRPC